MLYSCTFSCTSAHTVCYAAVHSLAFRHIYIYTSCNAAAFSLALPQHWFFLSMSVHSFTHLSAWHRPSSGRRVLEFYWKRWWRGCIQQCSPKLDEHRKLSRITLVSFSMKLEMCYSKFVEFLKKSEVILQHENSSAVYAWEMFRGWQAVIKIQKVWRGHRSRMMVQDSYPIVESSHTVLRATITTFSRVPECVLLTSGCGPAEKTRGGRVSFFYEGTC